MRAASILVVWLSCVPIVAGYINGFLSLPPLQSRNSVARTGFAARSTQSRSPPLQSRNSVARTGFAAAKRTQSTSSPLQMMRWEGVHKVTPQTFGTSTTPLHGYSAFDNINVLGWSSGLAALFARMKAQEFRTSIWEQLNSLFLPTELIIMGLYIYTIPRLLSWIWFAARYIHVCQLNRFRKLPNISLLTQALKAPPSDPIPGSMSKKAGAVVPAAVARVAPESEKKFADSLLCVLQRPARILGWSFLGLYIFDILFIMFQALSHDTLNKALPMAIATVVYMSNVGNTCTRMVTHALYKFFPHMKDHKDTRFLVSRGSQSVVWGMTIIIALEMLSLEMGVALGSLLSVAGVSTLAIGFSLKEIITNLIGGLYISFTNPFFPYDEIQSKEFGKGIIDDIGWMRTVVRHEDNSLLRVPNSYFMNHVIANMSRRTHRQLKTMLSLKYADIDKVTDIVNELKFILKSDPLVDYQNRPFKVCMAEYADSSVEVEVEVHYKTFSGSKFNEFRQNFLQRAADVIRKRGADFAFPTMTLAGVGADGGVGVDMTKGASGLGTDNSLTGEGGKSASSLSSVAATAAATAAAPSSLPLSSPPPPPVPVPSTHTSTHQPPSASMATTKVSTPPPPAPAAPSSPPVTQLSSPNPSAISSSKEGGGRWRPRLRKLHFAKSDDSGGSDTEQSSKNTATPPPSSSSSAATSPKPKSPPSPSAVATASSSSSPSSSTSKQQQQQQVVEGNTPKNPLRKIKLPKNRWTKSSLKKETLVEIIPKKPLRIFKSPSSRWNRWTKSGLKEEAERLRKFKKQQD